jgi:magnesium-transporting ATPase (P-type)
MDVFVCNKTVHFHGANDVSMAGDPDPPLFAFLSFWSNIILFNVMVPISLYVTLELIKLGQVWYTNIPLQRCVVYYTICEGFKKGRL